VVVFFRVEMVILAVCLSWCVARLWVSCFSLLVKVHEDSLRPGWELSVKAIGLLTNGVKVDFSTKVEGWR